MSVKGIHHGQKDDITHIGDCRRTNTPDRMSPVAYIHLNKRYYLLLVNTLVILLFAALLNMTAAGLALADPSNSVEITGEGVTTPVTLTRAQLEEMEHYEHVYSVINTWPTKKWYVAKGVKLRDLFDLAGLKEDATLVKFTSNDGFEVTLTVQQLLRDKRYYFPRLMDNHPSDGSIPGSPADAIEVEPILALVSVEDSNDPSQMIDRDSLLLVVGQRVVTEQTNPLFLKYVNKIEILTTPPQKWDNPKADMESGEVPAGSMIKLSSKRNDMDKIHYTTDGSIPTINSPVFNWSASRWWPLRSDLDSVNQPIQINEDTVIRAITIGPGKLDSDVVTFTYKADYTGRAAERLSQPGGPPTVVTLDQNSINLKIGSSYELVATVGPGNAIDKSVTWSSSDTSVATVDNNGLVTVIGPGTAVITVRTVIGNLTATCVVNSPDQDSSGLIAEPADAVPQDKAQEEPVEPLEPVPGEPTLPETEPATAALNNAGAVLELSVQETSPELEEPPKPEMPSEFEESPEQEELVENGRYLVEKEVVTAASITADVSSEQTASQPAQVFEMTVDAGPTQLHLAQNNLDIYTAGVGLFLFIFGGSRRYIEYVREVTR
ncbi:MAG: FN3 associated domain-containing protein [Desulfotomaculaceae bacterium]|nr:FN3 associated domain-containing protein [Desulfotomaculaceae bacterium]